MVGTNFVARLLTDGDFSKGNVSAQNVRRKERRCVTNREKDTRRQHGNRWTWKPSIRRRLSKKTIKLEDRVFAQAKAKAKAEAVADAIAAKAAADAAKKVAAAEIAASNARREVKRSQDALLDTKGSYKLFSADLGEYEVAVRMAYDEPRRDLAVARLAQF